MTALSRSSLSQTVVEVLRQKKISLRDVLNDLGILKPDEIGVPQTGLWTKQLAMQKPDYLAPLSERLRLSPEDTASVVAQLMARVYNAATQDGSQATEVELRAIEDVIYEDKYAAPFAVDGPKNPV
jgi:hypothetical protein